MYKYLLQINYLKKKKKKKNNINKKKKIRRHLVRHSESMNLTEYAVSSCLPAIPFAHFSNGGGGKRNENSQRDSRCAQLLR